MLRCLSKGVLCISRGEILAVKYFDVVGIVGNIWITHPKSGSTISRLRKELVKVRQWVQWVLKSHSTIRFCLNIFSLFSYLLSHPDHIFPSLLSSQSLRNSHPIHSSSSISLKKKEDIQATHVYQPAMVYQLAVRLGTSSFIKVGWGNHRRNGSQKQVTVRDSPWSHC